jgi:hypothetical protein
MNPITMIYKLKLKGYSLVDIGTLTKASRQLVWASIHKNPQRGKMKEIRNKIEEIINS